MDNNASLRNGEKSIEWTVYSLVVAYKGKVVKLNLD